MKWAEEADPDDIDEEDKTAFDGLRRVRAVPPMRRQPTYSFSPLGTANVHGFSVDGRSRARHRCRSNIGTQHTDSVSERTLPEME